MALFFNEGNYYVFLYMSGRIYSYRLDRMEKVDFCKEAREGSEAFKKYDLATYPKRAFNMFGKEANEITGITIRFESELLDSAFAPPFFATTNKSEQSRKIKWNSLFIFLKKLYT